MYRNNGVFSVGSMFWVSSHCCLILVWNPFKYTSSRLSFAFRLSSSIFHRPLFNVSPIFSPRIIIPRSSTVLAIFLSFFDIWPSYHHYYVYRITYSTTHICNKQCVYCAMCIYSQLMQMGVVFILSTALLFSHFRFSIKQIWCISSAIGSFIAFLDYISVFDIAIIIKI